jgi:lysophospholipase L1-like esterase
MRKSSRQIALWSAIVPLLLAAAGCQNRTIKQAHRTEEQRQALIKPGNVDKNEHADRLRFRFDYWNEQIVREDVAVGTVFFGDSITEMWELDAWFVASDGVILNRGIGGDVTPSMAHRFEADVIQLKPRNVVILAGTNDAHRMLTAGNPDEEIIAQVVTNLERMARSAQAAGINVFLCSILPTNPDTKPHEGKARILPQINEKLEAYCSANGCIYVDYASALADDQDALRKDLANDGLHPHWAGYQIMVRVLQDAAKANKIRL